MKEDEINEIVFLLRQVIKILKREAHAYGVDNFEVNLAIGKAQECEFWARHSLEESEDK